MNLIIDIGNTRIKVALSSSGSTFALHYFNNETEVVNFLKALTGIKKAIVASVTGNYTLIQNYLSGSAIPNVLFNPTVLSPLKNCYGSANTLGSDRLAAAIGSAQLFKQQNVLSIDAGTCIKYNFVSAAGEFLGGAISPGVFMRLRAMNEFTAQLPLPGLDNAEIKLIGTNTHESLLSGAVIGAASEIDGIVERYKLQYSSLKTVICGGDAALLQKHLKNSIFAEPNLVLIGLNATLELNT